MLSMAWSWPERRPAYEDMAFKFFEHFVHIADAMNTLGGTGRCGTSRTASTTTASAVPDGHGMPLKVRSLVGCCR
jgi:hypothetical protein